MEYNDCPNCGEPKSYGRIEMASDDSFARRSWNCDECGAYGDEYFTFDEDSWSMGDE